MKNLSVILTVLCLSLFISLPAIAQVQSQPQQQPQQPQIPTVSSDELSDEDLIQFIETSNALRPIQEGVQQDMIDVIENEGLDVSRFQQIAMAMQNPQQSAQLDITAEEESAMQTIQVQVVEIQTEAQQDMQTEIEEQGLEIERYQAIYNALQQNPELVERLENLVDTEEESQ